MLLAHAASRLEVDPDEVQPRAYTTAAGEALFVDSVTAAAETIDQRKIAALAMALAAGLAEDRSRIDEERLVVRALAQLEAPQIRILAAVSSGQFPEPTASPGRGVAGARRVATPPPKRPATRTQRAILATLQAQGLVVDDTREMAKRADAETVDRVMSVLKHMAKVQDARDRGLPSPSLPVTPSDVERFRRRQAEQDQLQPDWRRTPFGDPCLATCGRRPRKPDWPWTTWVAGGEGEPSLAAVAAIVRPQLGGYFSDAGKDPRSRLRLVLSQWIEGRSHLSGVRGGHGPRHASFRVTA
jgi:hypothetical protein